MSAKPCLGHVFDQRNLKIIFFLKNLLRATVYICYMDNVYKEELVDAYNRLKALLPDYPEMYEVDTARCMQELQFALLDINRYAQTHQRKINKHKGYPDGNWYMLTLTSKPEDPLPEVMENHAKIMEYLPDGAVAHAVHEKSNIHHVHYIVNLPINKKNEERDLRRITKRICKFEKKVTSLKGWNGLCNYVLKRTYDDKTFVETLVDGVEYVEGKGYVLKIKS